MRTRVRATWSSRSMFDRRVRVRSIDERKKERTSIIKVSLYIVL
jgi:hypothetical protein